MTEGLRLLLDPSVLLTILLSALYGVFIGAVPGLTATMAVDDLNGVEYYFSCTAGDCHDSGWLPSRTYIDTDLVA